MDKQFLGNKTLSFYQLKFALIPELQGDFFVGWDLL